MRGSTRRRCLLAFLNALLDYQLSLGAARRDDTATPMTRLRVLAAELASRRRQRHRGEWGAMRAGALLMEMGCLFSGGCAKEKPVEDTPCTSTADSVLPPEGGGGLGGGGGDIAACTRPRRPRVMAPGGPQQQQRRARGWPAS